MLEKIKSSYFIKLIFSYVDENQKLKVVKINKSLQKIININIINYKLSAGKYIIYESNVIGKEYDICNDGLLFEGEYLNGKRHGKGKEFDIFYNKLIFEGEYLNGKRNGKGKEYYFDHYKGCYILTFEGEYLNGKRNGKGKEYFINGECELKFEGEYLDGKEWIGIGYDGKGNIVYKLDNLTNEINRKIKEYYPDGVLKFEGEYSNGKRNGQGKEYYHNGQIQFEGIYLNDLRWTGKGYRPFGSLNTILYELINGNGIVKQYNDYSSILEFESEYLNGKRNGKGKEFDNSGTLIFEGEYLNGKKHGKGKEYNCYGKLLFEGEYLYDFILKGKYYINEKLEFEGDFLYNKKWNGKGYDKNGNIIYELINGNGNVREFYGDGNLIFEGEYLNGKRNGKGIEYSEGKIKFEGEYLNGKRNGKGKKYKDGKLIFEGEYINGKRKELKKESDEDSDSTP